MPYLKSVPLEDSYILVDREYGGQCTTKPFRGTLNMKRYWIAGLALFLLIAFPGSRAGNRNAYLLPEDRGTAGTLAALERLPVYARVLEVTAHPDDESAGTLTWLSRRIHARTALFCLTRGEGGQNTLGKEKYDELGLVRTGELLRAADHRPFENSVAGIRPAYLSAWVSNLIDLCCRSLARLWTGLFMAGPFSRRCFERTSTLQNARSSILCTQMPIGSTATSPARGVGNSLSTCSITPTATQ